MSGHGPLAGAACDDGPDDAAGGVVPGVAGDELVPGVAADEPEPGVAADEPEPDGAAVIDGVVVLDPVAAVATVTPSPRARPTELPTIAAATNIRLCLMVLLRGVGRALTGPVWATGPPRSTRPWPPHTGLSLVSGFPQNRMRILSASAVPPSWLRRHTTTKTGAWSLGDRRQTQVSPDDVGGSHSFALIGGES